MNCNKKDIDTLSSSKCCIGSLSVKRENEKLSFFCQDKMKSQERILCYINHVNKAMIFGISKNDVRAWGHIKKDS